MFSGFWNNSLVLHLSWLAEQLYMSLVLNVKCLWEYFQFESFFSQKWPDLWHIKVKVIIYFFSEKSFKLNSIKEAAFFPCDTITHLLLLFRTRSLFGTRRAESLSEPSTFRLTTASGRTSWIFRLAFIF